jgi:hypothetical protein
MGMRFERICENEQDTMCHGIHIDFLIKNAILYRILCLAQFSVNTILSDSRGQGLSEVYDRIIQIGCIVMHRFTCYAALPNWHTFSDIRALSCSALCYYLTCN